MHNRQCGASGKNGDCIAQHAFQVVKLHFFAFQHRDALENSEICFVQFFLTKTTKTVTLFVCSCQFIQEKFDVTVLGHSDPAFSGSYVFGIFLDYDFYSDYLVILV